jgi:hypothetical protein
MYYSDSSSWYGRQDPLNNIWLTILLKEFKGRQEDERKNKK